MRERPSAHAQKTMRNVVVLRGGYCWISSSWVRLRGLRDEYAQTSFCLEAVLVDFGQVGSGYVRLVTRMRRPIFPNILHKDFVVHMITW